MIQLIGTLLVLDPFAVVRDFDTDETMTATEMAFKRQLDEDPKLTPLAYNFDPMYVEAEGFIVYDAINETRDVAFEDVSGNAITMEAILWTTADNRVFVVEPHHCYDVATFARIAA